MARLLILSAIQTLGISPLLQKNLYITKKRSKDTKHVYSWSIKLRPWQIKHSAKQSGIDSAVANGVRRHSIAARLMVNLPVTGVLTTAVSPLLLPNQLIAMAKALSLGQHAHIFQPTPLARQNQSPCLSISLPGL